MAWRPEAPSLALKRSDGLTPAAFKSAVFEVEVLMQLTAALQEEEPAAACRVPSYVGHAIVPNSQGRKQVMLVMSKLEGQPLDQWLYGHDENAFKTLSPAQLLDDPTPGGRLGSRSLEGAAATAAALLSQVAPVMSVFSGFAYHRDISAHNVLIHGDPLSEQFSILDFGLATGSRHFNQEWRTAHVSGDPRYFMPASWMIITFGTRQLDAMPDVQFRKHYVHRLDHFAMGVLSLEVFFGLWRGPIAGEHGWLAPAREAWRAYWIHAIGLFQMFHARGCEATRKYLKTSTALVELVEKLVDLCRELVAAADSAPGSAAAPLLRAAAGLLDWRGQLLSWREVPVVLQATAVADRTDETPLPHKGALEETVSTETPLTTISGDAWTWSEAASSPATDWGSNGAGSALFEEDSDGCKSRSQSHSSCLPPAEPPVPQPARAAPREGAEAPAATLLGRRLEFREVKTSERPLAESMLPDQSSAKEPQSALPPWHPGFPGGSTSSLPPTEDEAACQAADSPVAAGLMGARQPRSSCLSTVTDGLFRMAAERLQRRAAPTQGIARTTEAPRQRKPAPLEARRAARSLVTAK